MARIRNTTFVQKNQYFHLICIRWAKEKIVNLLWTNCHLRFSSESLSTPDSSLSTFSVASNWENSNLTWIGLKQRTNYLCKSVGTRRKVNSRETYLSDLTIQSGPVWQPRRKDRIDPFRFSLMITTFRLGMSKLRFLLLFIHLRLAKKRSTTLLITKLSLLFLGPTLDNQTIFPLWISNAKKKNLFSSKNLGPLQNIVRLLGQKPSYCWRRRSKKIKNLRF